MEDIYYFEDWVSDMLNSSDYSEWELMGFEEYYQNLLPFDENTDIFIKYSENKVRVGFCEHTQKEVVQEKFGDEWICIHEETREQELENIKQVKQQLNN